MSLACQRGASREERIARTHLEGYGAPASALAFQPKKNLNTSLPELVFCWIYVTPFFLRMLYPG